MCNVSTQSYLSLYKSHFFVTGITMDKRIEEEAAKALEKMGNDRYRLSLVVAKRAEQLANGATPLVDFDKNKNKLADIALYEIAENKITLEGLVETNR